MPKPSKSSSTATRSSKTAKVLSSKVVYRGKVFHVTSDEVVEPSGMKVMRQIMRHSGSVVVLCVDESKREPRVLLIRQYRYAAQKPLWELPAGRIDEGEDALTAAQRELMEETGYRAREWKQVLFYYPSPGFMDETHALFLARDIQRGKARPEEDEFITPRWVPVSQAVEWVMSGKIPDAKTIAGVLWMAQKLA
ncbi:MAG TPA: NUDIX hydrolase [candidate division Zixibacteria bacterium]|nr:NUDIX hydrolase [candidate division Zixibacteria bacterium]